MKSYSWLQAADDRIRAGDDEIAVMADYGWVQKITPAEREAVEWAVSAASNVMHPAENTLRKLLERLA